MLLLSNCLTVYMLESGGGTLKLDMGLILMFDEKVGSRRYC